MAIVARAQTSGEWIEIETEGGSITAIRPRPKPNDLEAADLWAAPAFWDIQINGRWGHSFSSPDLTVEQVAEIVRAQAALGTARLCPTLITAPFDAMRHGVRTIAAACDRYQDIAQMTLGIHLEGPFLSESNGYRGAHPKEDVRDPDWSLFEELQAASGHRIVLMTLAPERPGSIEFIRRATAAGVTIALGHTAADGTTIREATEAGAKLSTHLGNGIAATLLRHPNPIWHQAALDGLFASFIVDGHHLDQATLRVLARAKGPGKTILVSDASPLSGLPPGIYGEWAVEAAGKIVVAGTPYLAGSNQSLEAGLRNLMAAISWPLGDALETVTRNPAVLLGHPFPKLESGEPANLILFRLDEAAGLTITRTCVDGVWHDALRKQ
jgi:N-acetylglucosamine-6-phosphate deacetylase